ncbi:MAG: ExbD/TolR family protein [Thiohalomonadaceae bacterium]
MGRAHHYKRSRETPELDITTFLNLMVVLIPFLLVTAVFSRITIQELDLPEAAAGGSTPDKPKVIIEVVVREKALEVIEGNKVVKTLARREDAYDLAALSRFLLDLKGKYPDKEDATILIEPDIAYEDLIHVMDAVKLAEVKTEGSTEVQKLSLFPSLSIGDAP